MRIVGIPSSRRVEESFDVTSSKTEWYGAGIQCFDVVAVASCVCYVVVVS